MKKIASLLILLTIVNFEYSFAQTFSLLGSGCNNRVNAIVGNPSSGNIIYAGGEFDHAGGNPQNQIAKWNGSSWSGMDNGMDGYVRSLVFYNNDLYAAGDFIHAGSASTVVWMVTKWNGSSWVTLGNGLHGVGVYSLATYQGDLYAGGFFDSVYTPGNGIAKWNGSSWVALGAGQNKGVFGAPGYRVRAMKTFSNKLFVGGTFTTAGGITVNNIAKWDGTSWTAVGTGTNGDVNAFVVYNGELYAGGNFTVAGGVTVNHIAKINGNTFSVVGGGTNGVVNALAAYQNNLYVTGDFGSSGAITTQNISRWDGTSWHSLTPSIPGIDGPGKCLTAFNGDLFIGGLFSVAGTVLNANSIVRWNFPVGFEETNKSTETIKIYPNPSTGKFNLHLTEKIPEEFNLSLTDISGRELFSQKINAYIENVQIDVAEINSGVYFLKLINGNTVKSTKLIIE